MYYGMKKDEFYTITNILKTFSPKIKFVKLFGSRARGDYKKTSDVDLAISSHEDILFKIKEALYESQLNYTFDLVDYNQITNEKLKNNIDLEGKIIIITDEKGVIIMNENKLVQKLDDYKQALIKLEAALEKDPYLDDIILDGTIKRFEFTFELSWKLMKSYLEYKGILNIASPRDTIREAFKNEIIIEATPWLNMMESRNLTSHTYDETTAFCIYEKIKNDYIKLFQDFDKKITMLIK